LREFQYASSNFLILFINQTFRDFFIENKLFFFEYFYVLVSACINDKRYKNKKHDVLAS
jgi:hypothetical protein